MFTGSSWWGRVGGMPIESTTGSEEEKLPAQMKKPHYCRLRELNPWPPGLVLQCGFRSTTPDCSTTKSVMSKNGAEKQKRSNLNGFDQSYKSDTTMHFCCTGSMTEAQLDNCCSKDTKFVWKHCRPCQELPRSQHHC